MHFEVGVEMAVLCQLFLQGVLPERLILDSAITIVIVCVVGYGFELYSFFTGRGHYEVMDAVAVIAGGFIGLAAALTLHSL